MKASANNQQEASASPQAILTPAPSGLIQRKCACGGSASASGDCEGCNKKRLSVQRFPADRASSSILQPLAATPSHFGHHIGRVRVHNYLPQGFQAKLNISQPADQYEQEADRIAEQVVRASFSPASPQHSTPVPTDAGQEVTDDAMSETVPIEAPPMAEESPVAESTPTESAAETEAATVDESVPTEAEAEAEATSQEGAEASGLITEDDTAELTPGQMRKSAFLDELRSSVCSTADAVLSTVGRSAEGCPYIEGWIGYYRTRSSQQIERAIRRYAPEAADVRSASDYIPIVNARIRRGVLVWATTGEITGVPEELQGQVGAPNTGGANSEAGGGGRETVSIIRRMFFKPREGGPKEADPQQIQSQLNSGQSLQSDVKSRMESAFGYDFSRVRIHTDSNAAALASGVNARAFTIGRDIAFGAGEYQPGSLVGDALLAHELAHVVQQGDANPSTEMLQKGEGNYDALEEDADNAAVGAVVSMWGRAKGAMADMARNAMPQLKSGLRLSRCSRSNSTPTPGSQSSPAPTPATPPAPAADCCCCPTSITIRNITQIDTAQRMGHSFNTDFALTYTGTGTKKSCSLLWEEKTNVPYTSTMPANRWHDMTADPETAGSFAASWAARREPCPGTETVTDTDPPSLGKNPGRTVTRTLEFRITVTGGSGCTCAHQSLQMNAVQTLAMVNATSDWPNSSFPLPSPVP